MVRVVFIVPATTVTSRKTFCLTVPLKLDLWLQWGHDRSGAELTLLPGASYPDERRRSRYRSQGHPAILVHNSRFHRTSVRNLRWEERRREVTHEERRGERTRIAAGARRTRPQRREDTEENGRASQPVPIARVRMQRIALYVVGAAVYDATGRALTVR